MHRLPERQPPSRWRCILAFPQKIARFEFPAVGGLIEKVAPKQYRITERGRAFLDAHPEEITTRDLEAIDGWEEAWNADAPGGPNTPAKDSDDDDPSDADPEIIEARIKRK